MGRFFISHPIFAISLSAAVVLLGIISAATLPIEQYPDITPPVVEVSATYDGADAETVNNAVATPVAQSIMGVSDMLYMQATSANDGTMNIQVTFGTDSDPDMDAVFTQNNVASAMAQLPAAVTRQGVTTRKTMTGFLLVYSLYSDGRYDDKFLSNYAYINIENELLKIGGVGKVNIMGAGEYAMRIWLRPDLLDYYDISLQEITSAVEAQGGIYPAGKFGGEPAPEGIAFTYTVTMPPQINDAAQYGDIIIKTTPTGEQIRLSDIAEVALGSQSYGSQSRFGDKPTAMIVVYQQPGSNAVEVGRKVDSEMQRLAARFPDGISYATIVDGTTSIRAGIEDIFRTLVIALILVIAIIYLFIQDWRATLIPLIAIPVSITGAFAVFPLLGFSINIVSLLGMVLAIGLVVDDAIVIVEAVQVNIERGLSPRDATAEALRSVSSPIVATTVVLLAVFIPVSFTGDITGELFRQFSVTIAVSVVISAFNALSLAPALCTLLLRRREQPRKGFFAAFNRMFDRRMESYVASAGNFVRRSVRTGVIVAAICAAAAVIWWRLPSGFLPEEDEGFVMVSVTTPDASSLHTTLAAMSATDRIISARSDVEATSYAAGFNMQAGVESSNSGIIFVKLVDYKHRKLSSSQIASLLTRELYAAIPQAQCYAFIPPAIPGLGVTSALTLQVLDREGRGTEYLASQARRLIDTLRRSKGIASVETQFNDNVPQRRLVVDKDKALAQGVSLPDFYSAMATLLGGSYIGSFNRFGKLYQTYAQAAPEYRRDRYSLDSYFVTDAEGNSIPVSSFVEVRDTTGVEFVEQFNLYRSIALDITPDSGTSSGQAIKTVEAASAAAMPDDISTAWSGMAFQQAAAASSGPTVYLLALAFVFLTLAALYESWGLPLAILFSVPAAILGALGFIGVAHLADPTFINDIYMQISMVMLIGLAAKNAILVAEYADRLFFEEGLSLADAAAGAARMRIRPIIMTAFAFILGVLPLVFASGAYSTARNIMGLALVGGMTVATAAGAFLYPALYYLVGKAGRFERKRELKRQQQ